MRRPAKKSLTEAIYEAYGVISRLADSYGVAWFTVQRWIKHYELQSVVEEARSGRNDLAEDVLLIAMERARKKRTTLDKDGNVIEVDPLPADVANAVKSSQFHLSKQVKERGWGDQEAQGTTEVRPLVIWGPPREEGGDE